MKKALKTIIVVSVMVAFVATVVICCCAAKSVLASMQKASCSHCASKAAKQSPSSHECCLTKASPMEMAKNVSLPMAFPWVWVPVVISFLYIVPSPRQVFRSIYLNGPPGQLAVVPLYIQSCSFRI